MSDILKLNVAMPFGPEPGMVHAVGAEAKIMDTQEHGSGQLLYVEFTNGVRTWLHEKYFDQQETSMKSSEQKAIKSLGQALRKIRLDEHKGGCNGELFPEYPDACDCGYTALKTAAKAVGIKL